MTRRGESDRPVEPPRERDDTGTRAPGTGGEAAGTAGGPDAPAREVPQDPGTGKGEDEKAEPRKTPSRG